MQSNYFLIGTAYFLSKYGPILCHNTDMMSLVKKKKRIVLGWARRKFSIRKPGIIVYAILYKHAVICQHWADTGSNRPVLAQCRK